MPGGDKTGPMGQGPMTGRKLGICGGFNRTGFMGDFFGGGFGRGRGMGFRRHNIKRQKNICEISKMVFKLVAHRN